MASSHDPDLPGDSAGVYFMSVEDFESRSGPAATPRLASTTREMPMPKVQFNKAVATRYDEDAGPMFAPELLAATAGFLAEHAQGGAALEFAVGTGRVALPLHARGVPVAGIDVSQPMLDQLAAKAGAADIPVRCGDIATTRVEGSFQLVYLVYNTITNLTSQDEQVACFQNAADHLAPGGRFVIEVYVPQLRSVPPGERVRPYDYSATHLGFDEFTDFVNQIQVSHHYWFREGGETQNFSAPYRYVWPSELDLMARLAGMTLKERWADWSRAPFTGESRSHVSVWQKGG